MLQVLFALLVVLAAIAAIAWLFRRFPLGQNAMGGAVRVVGGVALGPRERLVLVEVGETWLLVTSAYHMPRSMGIFRAQDMNPVAFPVDYRTIGTAEDWKPPADGSLAIRHFETAVREWIGLLAYRLTGKSDALFPAP